jgi:zinc transport system substrate-binding protein
MERVGRVFLFFSCLVWSGIVHASSGISVSTSIPPLAHFIGIVGGDRVDVICVAGNVSDPHEFEPTPSHIRSVYASEIFIYNGGGIDRWAERLGDDLRRRGIIVIEIMKALRHRGAPVDSGDPHVWLDPVMVQDEILIIRDALMKADPLNKEFYFMNARRYMEKLKKLEGEFRQRLKGCRIRDLFITHNAINYLARRYGFKVHALMGIDHAAEPSPRRIIRLIELMKRERIKYIYSIYPDNRDIIRMISSDTGAKHLTIYTFPLSDDTEAFISIMRTNLANLRKGLECR